MKTGTNLSAAETITWTECILYERPAWQSNAVDFGLRDSKGRTVGAMAVIERRGLGFYVTTRAMRNGVGFGSSGPMGTLIFFGDDEVRALGFAKALGEKKIVACGKRYARAVANGDGKFAAR